MHDAEKAGEEGEKVKESTTEGWTKEELTAPPKSPTADDTLVTNNKREPPLP